MRAGRTGGLAIVMAQALAGCAGGTTAREEPSAVMNADVLSRLATHHVQDVYGVLGPSLDSASSARHESRARFGGKCRRSRVAASW